MYNQTDCLFPIQLANELKNKKEKVFSHIKGFDFEVIVSNGFVKKFFCPQALPKTRRD